MYTYQGSGYCKITRIAQLVFYRFFIIFIFWGTLLSALHAAQSDLVLLPPHHTCSIHIKHIEAAQASNSSTPQTIKHWQPVILPDLWESRWPNYSGVVWYRILWTKECQSGVQKPLALNIDSINMAGAVYLNQHLIWQDKNLTEPLSRSWNMPRYWILPFSGLKEGPNSLYIKVIGVATQSPGLGKVYIGLPETIIERHTKFLFQHRTLYFINLVISLTLGAISFLIWLVRRKDSTFGWFALASMLWACFVSNALVTETYPFANTMQLAKVNMLFLIFYVLCFTIYTWRFAERKYPKVEKFLWSLSLISGIGLFIIPADYLKWWLIFSFFYSFGLFLACCLFYQWLAYKIPRNDIRFLALILLTFILISCHDVYLILTLNPDGNFITSFAAPLTALAISLILAWRIAKNVNAIEEFNQTLESTVQQVSLDLKNSLDKKHQLEIENMRLQERLNLSHELHDGLGGSLVRSMILVDKSDNLDKQHFLSILKLLRSDLRQVIDSGSNLGTKIPESPVIWAAPIRRRFVQLFEELDIESEWQLPQQWTKEPTTLQCLTLARVAEEALTNIIKHSQATFVKVVLREQPQQLTLEIQDNGIGFDPLMVQEGLHVGLQSMQVRVKRIGGQFEIFSRAGETVIKVIL